MCAYFHQSVLWELKMVEIRTSLWGPVHDFNVTRSASSPLRMAAKEPGCPHEAGAFYSRDNTLDQYSLYASLMQIIHRINTFTRCQMDRNSEDMKMTEENW